MKRFSCILLGLCLFAGFLAQSAQAKYPPDGDGIAGKVISVADRYFIFDTDNFGTVKVFISANTNFQKNGRRASSAEVKAGVGVRVTGSIQREGVWESFKVNVTDK